MGKYAQKYAPISLYISLLSFAKSAFTFETSLRVTENIQSFLSEIANVASLPYAMIDNNVVNITDFYHGLPFLPGSRMFLNIKKMYMAQIKVLNLGFENKLYYAMINDNTFPEGIEMDASNMTFKTSVNGYFIQKNGLPMNYKYGQVDPGLFSFPFDCTGRPWYKQAKAFGSRLWTTPFMQIFPTLPSIAISNPIYRDGVLLGVVSANLLLGQISDYLVKSYSKTDRNVFVIDEPSGNLIGSSMEANLFTKTTAGYYLVVAKDSENAIISGATKKLMSEKWPSHLVIYEDFYLQSVLYKDAIPGVSWYVVVLFPANDNACSVPSSSLCETSNLCWNMTTNIDRNGNDINHYTSVTIDECKVACYTNPICVAMVYKPSTNECWIKNVGGAGAYNNETNYYELGQCSSISVTTTSPPTLNPITSIPTTVPTVIPTTTPSLSITTTSPPTLTPIRLVSMDRGMCWNFFFQTDRTGTNLDYYSFATVDQCIQGCLNIPTCEFIVYKSSTSSCWLRYAEGEDVITNNYSYDRGYYGLVQCSPTTDISKVTSSLSATIGIAVGVGGGVLIIIGVTVGYFLCRKPKVVILPLST
eukprot:gene6386-12917_t